MKATSGKRILYVISLCLLSSFLSAQDTIFRVDGTVQPAHIIEITLTVVRYTLPNDPEGPVYTISKRAIERIVREDGSVTEVQQATPSDTPPEPIGTKPSPRNAISLDVPKLFFPAISIGYERYSECGMWGLKIPFEFGRTPMYARHAKNLQTIGIGISIKSYIFTDIWNKFYAGISANIKEATYNYTFFDSNLMKHVEVKGYQTTLYRYGFMVGYQVYFHERWSASLQPEVALRSGIIEESGQRFLRLFMRVELNLIHTF